MVYTRSMYGTSLEKIESEGQGIFSFTFEYNRKLGVVKPLWIKYVTPTITVTYDGYDYPDFFEVTVNGEKVLFETKPFTLTMGDAILAKRNPSMFLAKLLWEQTKAGQELIEKIDEKARGDVK